MARQLSATEKYVSLAKAFRERTFRPLYLLYGNEPFFCEKLQRLAEEYAIEPDLKDFNYDLVYGDEVSAARALEACVQLPMMAERRLVIIRRFEAMQGRRQWAAYAKRPNPRAVVLLVCTKRPDFRVEPYRTLKSKAHTVEFKSLKRRQVPKFIRQHVEAAGGTIGADAAACLEDYVGTSLNAIAGELAKLQAYAGDRTHLTRDDVMQSIGQSRDINHWELRDALAAGRLADAERITSLCLQRSANRVGEAIGIVAMMGNYFTNVWRTGDLLRKGYRQNAIFGEVPGPDFVVRQYIKTAQRYGPAELRQVFSALTAADCELKGGSARDVRLILTLMMRKISRLPHARGGTRGYRA